MSPLSCFCCQQDVVDVHRLVSLANLVESKSEIVYKELPEDNPRQRCPDISLANETLKWNPEVPLDEDLNKTIEWFRSIL